ncbi:hypothetical protein M0D21_04680 [Aquimarina sp. D1M17]|nr:hypothetical protein [Aquimarina acroporae]
MRRNLKGVLNLQSVFWSKAEIIPDEPGQVMLPREAKRKENVLWIF